VEEAEVLLVLLLKLEDLEAEEISMLLQNVEQLVILHL
tara:strand:- start:303 stop:416 length:114 start_codon:yes stop_codon:yes gene_type:complete